MSVIVDYEVKNCRNCPYATFVYKEDNTIDKMVCAQNDERKEIPFEGIREDCPYLNSVDVMIDSDNLILL